MPALLAIPALLNGFNAAASAIAAKVGPAVVGTGLAAVVYPRIKNENNPSFNQAPSSLEIVPPRENPQTMLPPREGAPTSTGTAKLFFQKESAAQMASQPPLWAETPDETVAGKLKNLLSPSKNGGDGPKKPGGPNDKPPFDKAIAASTALGAANGLDLYLNSAGSEATPFGAVSAVALGAATFGLGTKLHRGLNNARKVNYDFTDPSKPRYDKFMDQAFRLAWGTVGAGYGYIKAKETHPERSLGPTAKFIESTGGVTAGAAVGWLASSNPWAALATIGALSLYESGGYEATQKKLFTTGVSQ